MIFAFCLESCLDTSLPLVIRQRKLYHRFTKDNFVEITTHVCAGQTTYTCVQVKLSRNVSTWSAGNQHLLEVDFETDS